MTLTASPLPRALCCADLCPAVPCRVVLTCAVLCRSLPWRRCAGSTMLSTCALQAPCLLASWAQHVSEGTCRGVSL